MRLYKISKEQTLTLQIGSIQYTSKRHSVISALGEMIIIVNITMY